MQASMSTQSDITTASATDRGRERPENQDNLGFFESTPLGPVWVICDGMGGSVGGKFASTMAMEKIREVVYEASCPEDEIKVGDVLRTAVERANRAIYARAQEDTELKGMGTTAVVLAIRAGCAHVAHVGDSRLYLIREGQICQLTKDHTLVRGLVEQGIISAAQAKVHPQSHVLSKAVGVKEILGVAVAETPLKLHAGDRLLMCTDGLTSQIDDQTILELVSFLDPHEACGKLIALANEKGGPDNVTVQIVRVNALADASVQLCPWWAWSLAAGLVTTAAIALWYHLSE